MVLERMGREGQLRHPVRPWSYLGSLVVLEE